MRSRFLIVAALCVVWVSGCDSEMPPEDGGPGDAAATCSAASECDDGLFCNGSETCAPDSADADAMGCVAGTAPCEADVCSEDTDSCTCSTDADGDGAISIACGGDDCDDDDPNRFPGNTEVCDAEGHDEDCDLSTLGDLDADEDGAISDTCCNPSSGGGAPTCGNDCDDARANVNGLATEACDGIDNDCDMATDEGVERTFYPDTDSDSFGDPDGAAMMGCTPPTGFVEDNTDCNDGDVSFNPLAAEQCATGEDEDCDGNIDEAGDVRYYRDFDGDDYGATGTFIDSAECEPPSGYVRIANDCNDMSGAYYPGAPDPCDRRDTDCNLPSTPGGTDTAEDMDDDGHAAIGASCSGTDVGFGVFPNDDCDDAAETVHPGATEICDRRDNVCAMGGGVLASEDMDGDGHSATDAACSGGFSRDDCNDAEITVYLGAPELCDRLDNDCSADGGVDTTEDSDNDMHAPIGGACSGGPFPEDDCDDNTASTYPGAPELCNRVDDVCASDGGVRASEDMDDDGYAPMDASCTGGPRPKTDCNDGDPTAYPGAPEACGGGDQNCNEADDASDPAAATWCGPFSICAGGTTCRLETPVVAGGDAPDRGSSLSIDGATVHGWGSADLLPGHPSGAYPTPIQVTQLAGSTSIDVGSRTGCAIAGGTVSCWGDGEPLDTSSMPDATVIPAVAGATQISVGSDTTCARFASEVRCWGTNLSGALGTGMSPQPTPTAVVFDPALAAGDAPVQVVSGSSHHCALMRGGTVQCWGLNGQGQLGNGSFDGGGPGPGDLTPMPPGAVLGLTDAVSLAADGTYTCAVRSTGAVSCWGTMDIGDFTTGFQLRAAEPTDVPGISDARQVTLHYDHLCARSGDGTVRCWGEGEGNELGDGLGTSSETPVLVSGLSDATYIAAGAGHTCALRATGDVVCWGGNPEGQLGDGTNETGVTFPVPVGGVTDALAVFAIDNGYCVRPMGGGLQCWGGGPLGDGTSDPSFSPVTVDSSTLAVEARSSNGASCMRNSDGTASCWGSGNLGSATASSLTPVPVTGLSDATVLGGGSGGSHNCAFEPSGLRCWGDNTYGQLATGDMTPSTTPVASAYTFTGTTGIGVGFSHTCVLHGGAVSCMGFNSIGQLGDGSTTASVSPVGPSSITDAVEIATGSAHNCVRHATGAVSCWGWNQNGSLGDGTVETRTSPVTVTGIDDAVSIATYGVNQTCVARTSGEVWCWGSNTNGALGNGSLATSLSPGRVLNITDAAQVATASGGGCALHTDGTVSCWGFRQNLGNAAYAAPPTTLVTALLP